MLQRLIGALVLGVAASLSLAASEPASADLSVGAGERLRQVNGERLIGAAAATPGIDAFLGIPFALPPVGELRWRAPVAFAGSGGTRRVQHFAPACMQSPRILDWYRGMAERFGASREVFADLVTSEDCLHLNVWAPAAIPAKPLPVMVFVHGGSNRSGWSFEPNYHGDRLAAEGAVVVSIAYRLGVFGFFSHPQLAANAVSSNFGLWDQLLALRWIQRHIKEFGGDPRRVTVFGESAGAGNLALLMLAPEARGLLQRAILQSGGDYGWPSMRSLADEQARGRQLARAFDATSPPDLAALRAMPAARLLAVAEEVFREHYHAPVIDGVLVRQGTAAQIAAREGPLQALLIGTNANEYFEALPAAAAQAALERALAGEAWLVGPAAREALRSSDDAALALDRLSTAESMLCPAQQLAAGVAASGVPVWMYEFARVREGAAAAQLRAYHGAELPYVFGTHDAWLPTDAIDQRLTREMMRAWVRFADGHAPAVRGLPRWPRFVLPGRANVLRFDRRTTLIDTPEPVLCGLYRERLARNSSQ